MSSARSSPSAAPPSSRSASGSGSSGASSSGAGSSGAGPSAPRCPGPGEEGVTRGVFPPGTLGATSFTANFVNELPGDPRTDNVPRQVNNAAYTFVKPTRAEDGDMTGAWRAAQRQGLVRDPPPKLPRALAAWSPNAAQLLGVSGLSDGEEIEIDVLSGSGELLDGMRPYSACYGGHQFGVWAGQLGDGRAITLGECNGWEVQLKGAGKTPYSRKADGRAVLRSSIREFLCSEAMHFANVPTTRAMSLVVTGSSVVRDMFYAGEPRLEPAAVVARLAPTFLRLGNFQLPAARDEIELLRALADYAIKHHFPDVAPGDYMAFAMEVARLNAIMVAHWMSIGFVHGVMNTDNFSILGLTIDYGPYGFLDEYDPDYTPNTTDNRTNRYTYSKQPSVAHWNILQFAQALVPISSIDQMQQVVDSFRGFYETERRRLFAAKLGIASFEESDQELLDELLEVMKEHRADWTNTWRVLIDVNVNGDPVDALREIIKPAVLVGRKVDEDKWIKWIELYMARVSRDKLSPQERVNAMSKVNPAYILRNYMAHNAIEKAERGDYEEMARLYWLLTKPYNVQAGMEQYSMEPPDWAQKRGVKVNSCSS